MQDTNIVGKRSICKMDMVRCNYAESALIASLLRFVTLRTQ